MKLATIGAALGARKHLIIGLILAAGALGTYAARTGYHHGVKVQAGADAAQLTAKNAALSEASAKLQGAAVALRAASVAINAINTEADRRAGEVAAATKRAKSAGDLADALARSLRARSVAYEAAVEAASARPSCRALLDIDLSELKECGL